MKKPKPPVKRPVTLPPGRIMSLARRLAFIEAKLADEVEKRQAAWRPVHADGHTPVPKHSYVADALDDAVTKVAELQENLSQALLKIEELRSINHEQFEVIKNARAALGNHRG